MTPQMTRRKAIAALGTAGLGGVLAACSNGDDEADAEQTTRTSTTTSTTSTSTSAAATATSDLASRFEEASSCSLTPEETEGPYYIDVDSIRSDIREDRQGTTLRLVLRIRDAQSCEPIRNAAPLHCRKG